MGVLADKRRARIFYTYLSRVYDTVNPLVWTESMRDDAMTLLDLGPTDRVLDVGCGTGFATEALASTAGVVHGIDQSAHQLDRARRKLAADPTVSLYLGDAERLPFRDRSFDVVWSSGSIEYWPRPVETLGELRRVVRPGGQVVVVGPDRPNTTLVRRLLGSIMFVYGEAEADRMFAEAGFSDVDHRTMQAHTGSPRAIVTHARRPET